MKKMKALIVVVLFFAEILILCPEPAVGITAHAPIYIDGNADFASKAATEGWVGDGGAGNPYIIENYDINASTANGIDIRNTSVYFVIRNCRIRDGKDNKMNGIYLYKVANGKIQNVSSYDNDCGVRLEPSSNNNIIDCNIYNNSGGVYIHDSPNNNIRNCNIYNNSWAGIEISSSLSTNNLITNCHIYNNSDEGIELYFSSDTHITYCNIYNNSYGIYIDRSPYNFLRNNILENNTCNFWVWGYETSHYHQDIDTSNNVNGKPIYYIVGKSNLVFDETMTIGYLGLVSCKNIIVKNLNYTNPQGLLLVSTLDSSITNCNIYDNSYFGIYLYYSPNNSITLNQIYSNGCGIWLKKSQSNKITSCNIYNNPYGILIAYSSRNSKITSCNIYNNSKGVYLYDPYNEITNCSIYNNSYGIYLYSYSSNNGIHYCNIYNNTYYGIYSESYQVNAKYCWWGSSNGPNVEGTGPGSGDKISANVLYDPWLVEPLDFTPPTIIQTSPNNCEIDVPLDTEIVIFFSEPMNTSTIPGNITINPLVGIKNYFWSKENTTLTLILGTNLSSYMEYTITINTNITDSGTMDSNGIVHYFIENHLQSSHKFSFRTKDIIAPIITIISPENGTITNQNITLIYTISDDVDSLGNLTLKGPANGTVYSDEGNYTITINVKDRANNVAEENVSFIIDKTSPNITITGVVDATYYNTSITPTIDITDTNLNITAITLNGSPFTPGTTITEEGDYALDVSAIDRAGNKAQKKISFAIDKTAPDIVILGVVDGTYYNVSVIPVINITDANLNTSSITLNGVLFTSNNVITEDGNYVLAVCAIDKAGNSVNKKITFTIDKTPPSIIASVVDGLYYNTSITLTIEINDANLDITSIKLNDIDFIDGIAIIEEGNYKLEIRATDKANNTAEKTISFVIDKSVPKINITGVINGKYYKHGVVPIINIRDEHLNATTVTLNNVSITSGTAIEEEGDYVLFIEAIDEAGNIRKKKITFTIDKTPPDAVSLEVKEKTETTITLTWNKSTEKNFDRYELWIATKKDFSDAVLIANITDINSTAYTVIGLSQGKKYYFKIKVVDKAGNERFSKPVSFSTLKGEEFPWLSIGAIIIVIVIIALAGVIVTRKLRKK